MVDKELLEYQYKDTILLNIDVEQEYEALMNYEYMNAMMSYQDIYYSDL